MFFSGQSTPEPEPDDSISTYVTFLTIFLMAVVSDKRFLFWLKSVQLQFEMSTIISFIVSLISTQCVFTSFQYPRK